MAYFSVISQPNLMGFHMEVVLTIPYGASVPEFYISQRAPRKGDLLQEIIMANFSVISEPNLTGFHMEVL